MTRTVSDAALMLQAIAGYDPEETTSSDIAVPDYAGTFAVKPSSLRIGVPRAHFYEGLHPEIQAAMDTALSVLGKLTSSQREIETPASKDTYTSILDAYTAILRAEAYAYHQDYVTKTPDLYQAETLKRIRAGAEIGAVAYIYRRRQVDQWRRSFPKVFEAVELLVTPTAPVPPFTIAELLADLDNLRTKEGLTLRNTRPFSVLGLPSISVPCGFTRAGLPIGMHITGPPGGEAAVLRLAYAYERETDWHNRRPSPG
jgi:aspartyl-tRNA(Asn)/glutamyl-tRNA(Gln) amidotransferase subunit A